MIRKGFRRTTTVRRKPEGRIREADVQGFHDTSAMACGLRHEGTRGSEGHIAKLRHTCLLGKAKQ